MSHAPGVVSYGDFALPHLHLHRKQKNFKFGSFSISPIVLRHCPPIVTLEWLSFLEPKFKAHWYLLMRGARNCCKHANCQSNNHLGRELSLYEEALTHLYIHCFYSDFSIFYHLDSRNVLWKFKNPLITWQDIVSLPTHFWEFSYRRGD